jgi:5-methylcytosine-specific restriction endonuclease McrA
LSDTLVINADGAPVSYLPLSAVKWKEAILYMFHDKCTVLDYYDDWMVHSTNWETKVPAVIMLKDYMRRGRIPRFSKSNLYLRDMNTCQYCNTLFGKHNLTVDHVTPVSLGGKTRWTNCVSACGPCNSRKSNKTTVKPLRVPYEPTYYQLVENRKNMPIEIRHPSWEQWLT